MKKTFLLLYLIQQKAKIDVEHLTAVTEVNSEAFKNELQEKAKAAGVACQTEKPYSDMNYYLLTFTFDNIEP